MILKNRVSRDNFTIVSNQLISESTLSWKAKGILIYLLSKPEGWEVRPLDIVKHAKDGRDAVYAGIRELIEKGYIVRTEKRDENGKFQDVEYDVYDTPQNLQIRINIEPSPYPENPDTGNPDTAQPDTENPDISNKDISNTDSSKKETTTTNAPNQSEYPKGVVVVNPDKEIIEMDDPHPENLDKGNPCPQNPDMDNPDTENYNNSDVVVTTSAVQEVKSFFEKQGCPIKGNDPFIIKLLKSAQGDTDIVINALLACKIYAKKHTVRDSEGLIIRAVAERWQPAPEVLTEFLSPQKSHEETNKYVGLY